MSRLVRAFPVGPLAANCVLLADDAVREALVVDPGGNAALIEQALAELQLRCVLILNTHAHIDHVGANAELKRWSGAPLRQHAADLPLYERLDLQAQWLSGLLDEPEAAPIDGDLADGTTLRVGALEVRVLHTPGHSPGSVCLFSEVADEPPLLIAGDTLMAGGVGRTDLPGGSWDDLSHSLRTRLLTLPDRTRVICGHGPETTIGRERRGNPFLQDLGA
jgi:hydroxyacylglutathione hydrolase